jgi:ribosomal 30S subunit maturation factor RimM
MRLDRDEYFESDLIGCEVIERDGGASLGPVVALRDGGSSGVLEVEGGLLIPFVRAICVAIQPEARRIVVDLPAGLKELNQT